MGLISIFKTPKHRQFNYRPIYYNAEKEELQERIRKIEAEYGIKSDREYKPGITRGSMRSGYFQENVKAKRKSGIRFLVILMVLLALAYFLIYSNITK